MRQRQPQAASKGAQKCGASFKSNETAEAKSGGKLLKFMAACSGASFAQFLVQRQPQWDQEILVTKSPAGLGWLPHVSTGEWPAGTDTTHLQDRLETTYPDTTQGWATPDYASCVGQPCDPTENEIGYGASRREFSIETQSWASQLFCYDQIIPIALAKESIKQYVDKILRPATKIITDAFLRKRALYWADTKIVANPSAASFNYVWSTDGTNAVSAGGQEIFLLTDQMPTNLLTPQLLQRQVQPLISQGYLGENPWEGQDMLPLLELVTDLDTTWELDHLGGITGVGGTPSIASNWRFQQWDAASKFWRYGLTGQVGNYAVRIDPEQLRFFYIGPSGNATYPYRFQVILPRKNIASSGAGGAAGIKSIPNPDYFTAPYRMSFIWHKKAMELQVQGNMSVNPEMPFLKRNFGGKWQFVMDNLTDGCDVNGNPIAVNNSRRNKGKFIGDFRLAAKPRYTEYAVAIFHMGQPMCLPNVVPCDVETTYAEQVYSSANTSC
jgi:hypothetical protein